ncbi:putative mediator of RNA polymerase II transcription subunit 26b [Dendrobium catenatum]|uniref:Putative mediator of RNA polymerase II transcription subunit 26b n=1 Tax=Dendrobium catenatum TaxID=906689 RepID=A0A2I0WJ43_9ASPA|nr:putative mediator of RNA polymerase II transcription subunit 26b [Dendrobium catenatum]
MIAEKLYTCHLSLNNGDDESLKEVKKDSNSNNPEENDQIVGEMMRIKEVILSNNQLHESDSYSILYESLRTLQKMTLFVDMLKTTKIERTICAMRKHSSSKIRKLARCLIDSWIVMVDEHVNFATTIVNKTTSNFGLGCSSKQTSEQKPTRHSFVGVKGKQSEEVSDSSKLEQEDNHDREVTPDLPSPGHDLQRDEEDKSVPSGGDINAKQNEQLTTEADTTEHKHRDYESNDPQYVPRRLHQNQRGSSGRRGGGQS